MDALEAGQVVVLDGVPVAEVEGDLDELVGRDEQAGLDDRGGARAELGVEPAGQLLELLVAQPDEAGPGLGPLGLLARLGGRGGCRRGGGRRRRPVAGRRRPRARASPRALARIMSILLGAFGAAGAAGAGPAAAGLVRLRLGLRAPGSWAAWAARPRAGRAGPWPPARP